MDNVRTFVNTNKFYIITSVIIVLILICWKFLSLQHRTQSTINSFEKEFLKYNKRTAYDFCGTKSNKTLSEFYVSSAYLPYLTGYQKLDYTSESMFNKVIKYGARFAYLQVFNKEAKYDTEPVLSTGNSYGTLLTSQNSISPSSIFKLIGEYAFSEKFIDNYTDPFIVFLDLRVSNNYNTLDKLYEIIKSTCGHLLYEKFNTNVSTTPMCNLMGKLLIFTTSNNDKSKLKSITHMDTSSSYLNLLGHHELPTKELISNPKDKPLVTMTSTKIRFNKNLIQVEDEIDFIKLGINKSFIVKINGSKKNDSEDNYYEINQVTHKQLILNSSIEFVEEFSGNKTQLKFFNKSYKLLNLPKENKNGLTIVTPEHDFFKMNYNPYDAFNLGCQFTCMNFQEIDQNLKTYMKKFKKFSILMKPNHLINYNPPKHVPNINSQFQPVSDIDIPVIFQFRYNHTNIRLKPILYNNLRMIEKNNIPIISPDYNLNNSYFEIEEGLDGKAGTISIKLGNKYLSSNDSCCWLSFQEYPMNKDVASFYPVKSLVSGKNTISICQIKNNAKYYLKHRLGFNYKTQLYTKTTNSYKMITSLSNGETIIKVYEPLSENNYKCYGQVLMEENKDPKTVYTNIVMGSTAHPIDFVLIYKTNNSQYIWKMVTKEGYIALGNIFTTSSMKPKTTNYYTIAFEYLNQVDIGSMAYKQPVDGMNGIKPMSLWYSNDKSYFIAYNSNDENKRPSEFNYPIFNLNTRPKTYNERLYLHKPKANEIDSASFIVEDEPSSVPVSLPIKYSSVVSSVTKYQIINIDTNNSINLPSSYWTDFNQGVLKMETQTSFDDYSNAWIYYTIDNTIRLKSKPNYGLTISNNNVVIDKISNENKDNQKFSYTGNNLLTNNNQCLYEENDGLKMGPINSSPNNTWLIPQVPLNDCININAPVYILKKLQRSNNVSFNAKQDFTEMNNILKEYIDKEFFHVYVEGKVTKLGEDDCVIELKGNLGFEKVSYDKVVPYKKTNISLLKEGSVVLCKNGGFTIGGYEEPNVRYKATIVKKLNEEKVIVLVNINTIEANLNKSSYGRPREIKEIIVNINDLILLKNSISCE